MPGFSLLVLITIALAFEFINGFHDTANAIAVVIHTGALSARSAILMASVMNLIGAFASENVARTISAGITGALPDDYSIMAALVAALLWNLFTWYKGIPSSSSHALIGGLIGAVPVFTGSISDILWNNVFIKIIVPLFLCPAVGFVSGILFSLVIKRESKIMQIIAAAFVAFAHGENDAQKTMGIITLALAGKGILCDNDNIPPVIKLVCALALAAGTQAGGMRIIDTMGKNLGNFDKITGLAAQISGATVMQMASAAGIPASTTQIVTSSILGARSNTENSRKYMLRILGFWIMTMPVCMFLGSVIMAVIKYI